MASIIKANQLQDFGGNSIITSDGAGTITLSSGMNTAVAAGTNNTPAFLVSNTANNTGKTDNAYSKMTYNIETFDTDSAISDSKFTVPTGEAGKYFFTLRLFSPSLDDIDYWSASVKKNGSGGGGFSGIQRNYNRVGYNGILTANGSSDYFEAYCEQESGSNRTINVSEFSAFYIGN